MKLITINQLTESANHEALFFTKEGIIVDSTTQSPWMDFFSTIKKLKIVIENIYLDSDTLIVECSFPLKTEFKNHFSVYYAKSFLPLTNDNTQIQILRAVQWLTWNERLQYCSKCGNKLSKVFDLPEKKCRTCNLSFFPNLSPAIMVLIQKGEEILLARSAHFAPGIYSAIAGFIDIGETAEAAVHREVFEEVGIKISKLTYFGSQSWPFPNSFMMAFTAHYLEGNLRIDPTEIEDAKWFNLKALPKLPSLSSIARKLIDSFHLQ